MKAFTLECMDACEPEPQRADMAPPLPEELFLARVGVAVRVLRITRRMTQRRLADLAGVTLSTINRLEQGSTAAHIITITAIERGLGVKPGWLIRLAS